jgi:hypothetical protein
MLDHFHEIENAYIYITPAWLMLFSKASIPPPTTTPPPADNSARVMSGTTLL